jgi:hypothetical protein
MREPNISDYFHQLEWLKRGSPEILSELTKDELRAIIWLSGQILEMSRRAAARYLITIYSGSLGDNAPFRVCLLTGMSRCVFDTPAQCSEPTRTDCDAQYARALAKAHQINRETA